MGNVQINYLGVGIQNLNTTNIEDAIWHLGAKYGAVVYNAGIQVGAIKIHPETNQIEVDVAEMNLLNGK
jgi:hypothetical protein